MAVSEVSVTWAMQTRPSQRASSRQTRSVSARTRPSGAVVQPQEHGAEHVGAAPRPVLERVLDEPGQRHHHAALIPDVHHHEGAGDLLDAAPFALDDDHVVQADRLGQRDLQAGDQVAEHRLGRDARHQPEDAGRGQQRVAELAHLVELQQHHRGADQDHRAGGHAPQHPRLGMDGARVQVVGHVDAVVAQDRRHDARPPRAPAARSRRQTMPMCSSCLTSSSCASLSGVASSPARRKISGSTKASGRLRMRRDARAPEILAARAPLQPGEQSPGEHAQRQGNSQRDHVVARGHPVQVSHPHRRLPKRASRVCGRACANDRAHHALEGPVGAAMAAPTCRAELAPLRPSPRTERRAAEQAPLYRQTAARFEETVAPTEDR